ncbi:hypothetical protein GCM10019016_039410 [Streptomyces prasinosporus]|uniref:Cytoskeleton protein RodZ-like C-terminal domain-containing protein n=1 Tax=Streptomyces prasinosporus TaxID=68256 RepID=A0ABP6TNF7_9ACTN
MTVRVSAPDGRSWISAKDHNGRLLFDGLLKQGESRTFQDSSKINLVLGDAGAIDLFVNGKKIEDDFQPGAVERLTYTKGDPAGRINGPGRYIDDGVGQDRPTPSTWGRRRDEVV